jgi:hypothetical protein
MQKNIFKWQKFSLAFLKNRLSTIKSKLPSIIFKTSKVRVSLEISLRNITTLPIILYPDNDILEREIII